MKSFQKILTLVLLLCSCNKTTYTPHIDQGAIYGRWKLKSIDRTIYTKKYLHSSVPNEYYYSTQLQTYTFNNDTLNITWETVSTDLNGNVISRSKVIGQNFEDVFNRTETEMKRVFSYDVEYKENSTCILNYISKKNDGTVMATTSYEFGWNWYSMVGSDEIWVTSGDPFFLSTKYIYDLHDNVFVCKSKIETGHPDVDEINRSYSKDENEVVFERY